MSSDLHSSITTIMMRAVRAATKSVHRDFAEIDLIQNSKSGTLKFAKNSEKRIQKILIEELIKVKKDSFITDNEGNNIYGDPNAEHRFLIVPLDNFTNFMHAIPFFASGVLYQKLNYKKEYETLSIVIDVPVQREFYYCEKGGAVWRETYTEGNTKPTRLRVSERKLPDELLVNIPNVFLGDYSLEYTQIGSPLMEILYMASGKFDAIILNQEIYEPFLAIITESGGILELKNGKTIARNVNLENLSLQTK